MANQFKVSDVSNHHKGTVVVLQKILKNPIKCTYKRRGRTYTSKLTYAAQAFFDKNNNGVLDKNDVMFSTTFFCKPCPARTKRLPIVEGIVFCKRSVTARHIRQFGKLVSPKFKTAKQLRRMLIPEVKKLLAVRQSQKLVVLNGKTYKLEVAAGSLLEAEADPFMTLQTFGIKPSYLKPDATLSVSGNVLYGFLDFK